MRISFNLMQRAVEAIHTPLIEILDDYRVLIENHLGIVEYSDGRITIKRHNGSISVIGTGLQVSEISKEKVVIVGKILGLALMDGGD